MKKLLLISCLVLTMGVCKAQTYQDGFDSTYSYMIGQITQALLDNPHYGEVHDPVNGGFVIDHFTRVVQVQVHFAHLHGYFMDKAGDSPFDAGCYAGYQQVFADWMLGSISIP